MRTNAHINLPLPADAANETSDSQFVAFFPEEIFLLTIFLHTNIKQNQQTNKQTKNKAFSRRTKRRVQQTKIVRSTDHERTLQRHAHLDWRAFFPIAAACIRKINYFNWPQLSIEFDQFELELDN